MPNRPQLAIWNPDALTVWAERIRSGDVTYNEQLPRARNRMVELDGSWTGLSHDAAYDRIGEDFDEGRKLSYEVLEFVEALEQAAVRLTHERRVLLNKVDAVEAEMFLGATYPVGDDWRVGVVTSPDVIADDVPKIEQRAQDFQEDITAAYRGLTTAIDEVIATITANGDEIRARGDQLARGAFVDGPSGWTSERDLTADLGADDGASMAAGPLSAAEIERLEARLASAGLSPEQLTTIANGGDVEVDPRTMEYLAALYNTAGADGLLQLSEQLRSDSSPTASDLRTGLANGLLTLSNEQVVAHDATGTQVGRGGWDRLPEGVRDLLDSRPAIGTMLSDTTGPPPHEYTEAGGDAVNRRELSELADLLHTSDPHYQPGDRLGAELSRQAAYQADLTDDVGHVIPGYTASEVTITHLLDVGTRNIESNHALITGIGDENVLGADYHRDNVMVPLLTHEWADDGAALSNMFSWIGADSAADGALDPVREQRAGEAAFGLAQLLSSTESGTTGENLYATWLDMPSGDGQSLGQVNPVATQALAYALGPYTGSMIGMSDSATGTTGFGNLGGPIEAVRVFSVLNGDPEAGQIITSAALAESMRLDGLFATNERQGIDSSFLGFPASDLRWLATTSLDMEISERQDDVDTAAAERSQRLNAAYTGAEIIVGGFGPVQAGFAAAAELVRPGALTIDPEIVGPHPETGAEITSSTQFGTTPARMYQMVTTLHEQGFIQLDDLPNAFIDGDRLRNFSELMGNPENGVLTDRYANNLAVQELPSILANAGINDGHLQDYTAYADGRHDYQLNRLIYPLNMSGPEALGRLTTDIYARTPDNRWPVRT